MFVSLSYSDILYCDCVRSLYNTASKEVQLIVKDFFFITSIPFKHCKFIYLPLLVKLLLYTNSMYNTYCDNCTLCCEQFVNSKF